MHIDGVRPPPLMSVLPAALPSSATAVPVLPQLLTTSSSVQLGTTAAAPRVGGVVVQQPTAAGIRVGSVVTAPRTAAVTQQTLSLAAVCIDIDCHQLCHHLSLYIISSAFCLCLPLVFLCVGNGIKLHSLSPTIFKGFALVIQLSPFPFSALTLLGVWAVKKTRCLFVMVTF